MFDYNSKRAKEARFGKKLGVVMPFLWVILGFLIVAFGVVLFLRSSLCWLCLMPTFIIIMYIIWYKKWIIQVPVGKSDNLNDVLSGDCLAAMPKNPTPRAIAEMTKETRSGRFMAVRFGLSTELLVEISSYLGDDAAPIFEKALLIRKETGSEEVDGAIMAVALVLSLANYEYLLKRMKLEKDDLYSGIVWYNYLYNLVSGVKKRSRDGGIARDLSFGYIPILQRFGQNLSLQVSGNLKTQMHQPSHQEVLDKMMQTLAGGGRRNVALIGPEGCGKSTAVRAFAERLMDADEKVPSEIRFRQVFMLDAARLVSIANGRGEMEALMQQIMNEAFLAKNIILFLDNAQLFFEEGTGSVDITSILLPVIEAGVLPIILTMDEQCFLRISAKNSSLTNALNRIMVQPANYEETMKIMQDQVPIFEYRHKVTYTYWALLESYRLSERYIHGLTMPGRALNLLEASASFAESSGFITAESVQRCIEKTVGVKVSVSQDMESRERLLNLEGLIHQRMIDQEEAVAAVSNALRRAAAGVRNENRPIGTFLFMGPTGVGKTELAKALSEVYFEGESQLVRLDMNEFVSSNDVSRLIADGADDEFSLTAQVMKQPFSVVLLDEIEKADGAVLTTLLQMLDEGILRDVRNREVSFRDTIVICTTNAKDLSEFKPEFVNRFDEVCQFHPLSKENLVKVVDLMINSVNKTLAPQKIIVRLDERAKELLVDKGYDSEMGARPMRRIVQKTVENIVAKMVLSGNADSGAEITITSEMIEGEL